MSLPTNTGIFSVSRLNQTVRQLLELEMGRIWLNAEISNFSQPSSGHWYFTLKDERAQIRAAMFRSSNLRATFRPQNGQQVLVRAQITLYEPRGDYQLIVESIQPAGDGLLQQQFEVLKQKLTSEGLFDSIHKKPLPSPAKCLGVITSASGAALHDILNILKRRDPSLPIIIYPTAVQGAEAPLQIIRAIELANDRQECDVLIVGRGGGSLEDLWCFNDEQVARAIFQSRIPIVSAVGHETDVTIADFIADLRAPTPSAAAELVSRNQIELLRQVQSLQQRLEMAMDYFSAQKLRIFNTLQHQLQQQRPDLRLARQQNKLVELRQKLVDSLLRCLKQHSLSHEKLNLRLLQTNPDQQIRHYSQQIQQYDFRLKQAIERQLGHYREKFAVSCSQLNAVSPLATLQRGYSISETTDGTLLKETKQVKVGDTLNTRLQDGWVKSQVIQVKRPTKREKSQ
ncbi:exodeoxyribonuclease VII large subunit [Xenorhabdus bovienii]|uniref:exodeoxyribonuclease VII large subunit n=1 Tax=Xenorhabdus bovienii TaxID=40576 RepID=UPI0023B2F601|nr:exodeoxyribonuclease VII large subunit [Xenorhabdus bovienii]MDE9493291.1 exodeoxyribonuclease VII large subunit [Xenorhabdus bovienii]MDE9501827.1 exodeoxyribonuclease VII large subunit [Xenorhabdus bovienii]MDE9525612.1 exodeoxyribonuclease VII large subunit [Xenorhabdus bovienii]MDE9568385.1 exodeoxyribonuclease VII large subunit [Xenorhabdus bovienii]